MSKSNKCIRSPIFTDTDLQKILSSLDAEENYGNFQLFAARINEVNSGRLFNYTEVKNMGLVFRRYLKKKELSGKGYNLRTFRKNFISRSQEAGNYQCYILTVGHVNIKTTMTY